MDREAHMSEREDAEEVPELEMLTLYEVLMMAGSPAAHSSATERPVARTTTTTTRSRSSRPSRLARRPSPPPAWNSVSAGHPAPALEGLFAAAAMQLEVDGNHDQPPEARRQSQEQEREFQFFTAGPPSVDHIRRRVPPSSAGGGVPPRPPRPPRPPMAAPARRETEPASTRARTEPRVVKFRSAHYVWIVLSRLPMDPPPPPRDCNTGE